MSGGWYVLQLLLQMLFAMHAGITAQLSAAANHSAETIVIRKEQRRRGLLAMRGDAMYVLSVQQDPGAAARLEQRIRLRDYARDDSGRQRRRRAGGVDGELALRLSIAPLAANVSAHSLFPLQT